MNKLSKEQEQDLLSECIYKDQCTELVNQYYNLIKYTAVKIYSAKHIRYAKEDIEDRIQEVFEKLFEQNKKKLRQYDQNCGLRLSGWITLISTQTVISYFRKKKEWMDEKSCHIPIEEFENVLIAASEKGKIDARQKLLLVEEALNKLDPQDQLVLKLEWFYGYSPSEIAQRIHRTVNNIYTIKSRAIDRIKEDLEKIRSDL